MNKKIILLAGVCFLASVLSGCAVITYPLVMRRVDQDLSGRNRGYIVGEPKLYGDEQRKTTRQIQLVELRALSLLPIPFLPIRLRGEPVLYVSESEVSPDVSVLETTKIQKEPSAISAPTVIKPVDTNANLGLHGRRVIFGFGGSTPTWEIPDWCFEKTDYVGKGLKISRKFAQEGESSLELIADFPGARWTAAYCEVQEYFDWTAYKTIAADIFLPEDAPKGLKANIILTVGENWTWTEMARLVKLIPGEWTAITASFIPGSTDWRKTQVTDEFRADVRKLGIRIESNMRPVYSGPIYIDNVRLE